MGKNSNIWRRNLTDFGTNLVLRGLIGGALMLPYRWRLALVGWAIAKLVFPLAGHDRRMRANLAYVCPDLPEAEVKQLLWDVPNNFGRTLIEEYSGRQFVNRVSDPPTNGPGLKAIEQAQKNGRPVVIVTGHFGNYDALRATLVLRGFTVGGLYRPFNNRRFDRHYRRALEAIGTPIFPRSRRGETQMLRFLRSGGIVGILSDQHMDHGASLTFFGKPAATALSSAKMALKYDALLVPAYAARKPDGVSFDILFEKPIPHTTPETMSQQLNDSLETQVRKNMGQWLWSHRRWKIKR